MSKKRVASTTDGRVGINLTDTRTEISFNLLPEDAMRIGTKLQNMAARRRYPGSSIACVFPKNLFGGMAAVRLTLTKEEADDLGRELHDEAMTAGQG
jgi:hypothetical protein